MKLNKKISISIWIIVLVITILLVFVGVVFAPLITVVTAPYTFTTGTTISASQMNTNFQTLAQAMPALGTNNQENGTIAVSTTWQNVASITFTPPSNGSVLLMATANVSIGYQNSGAGGQTSVVLCLTPTSGGNNSAGSQCGSEISFSSPPYGGDYDPRITVPAVAIATVSVTKNTPVTYYLTTAFPDTTNTGVANVQGECFNAMFFPSSM